MSQFVTPRLVNPPFGDPGVFLDLRFGARALLFDIGDLSPLPTRELLRVTDVFISHLHLDHFVGFDRLLRINLYNSRTIRFFGPPGLIDGIASKLAAYSWNLLGQRSANLILLATEWLDGITASARFRARNKFGREPHPVERLAPDLIHAEDDFCVEAAALDHGIPSLAYALQERRRVNVHKTALDAAGLPVGPWLTTAKALIRREEYDATVEVDNQTHRIGALIEKGVFHLASGQRVAYATDFVFSPENAAKVRHIAARADQFFIESAFSRDDAEMAGDKLHMTTAQSGMLAREAGARRAIPMHFSPRYIEEPERLPAEFARAFEGRD